MNDETLFEKSSGNVFRDLGIPNPEDELLKARLGIEILNTINDRKLTDKVVADILSVKQSEIAQLINGKFSNYSLESMFRFHNLMNRYVNIHISKARHGEGRLAVGSLP